MASAFIEDLSTPFIKEQSLPDYEDAQSKNKPSYFHRANAFALALFSTSVFLVHLFISAACFDLRRTSFDIRVQRAAYVVAVMSIVSASFRVLQLFFYAIGDRMWIVNARMGNGAVSVLLAAVMLGATAPRTSVLFETRAADTVPTEAAVFYCAVVAAVGTLAEVITSHTAIVKMETRRTSLVAGESRATQMRLLIVAVTAVFTAATLGMNAYAILASERLRHQTAVPRLEFTQQAMDAILAAGTLRNFLIVAISFNSFSAVTGVLSACSTAFDGNYATRMIRLTASFLGIAFLCVSLGAVLPQASLVGVARDSATAASYAPADNYARVTQASVASTFALSVTSLVMYHIVAASRVKV
jgi:hypothetical protein